MQSYRWSNRYDIVSGITSSSAFTLMGCLHDPANVQQTFSKCIQNTRANAGRLLDHVNTL